MTHQQIGDAVGKSRATITNLLRLNELNPAVKELLLKGLIEMGHARALLAVPKEGQDEVAREVAKRQLTVRATEGLIRRLQQGSSTLVKRSDPDVVQLSNRLAETFGAKVEIRHSRRGAGKLVISYANLDHLQGIIDRLTVSAPAVDLYGTH